MSKHSINCDCYDCTGGDAYLKRLKSSVGKNAKFSGVKVAPRSAIYGQIVAQVQHVDAPKFKLGAALGGAFAGVVGDLINARESGQPMPKALAKVADLGIKTKEAAKEAGIQKVEQTLGNKILKFAPEIIGVLAILVSVIIYLLSRRK